ncbi:MAG TPA: lysozyme [Candidatus Binataceae bacterium]|nr:lysozyme [Candidatus Binataceae bacterium]
MRASGSLFDFLKAPRMEGYSRVLYDHDGAENTSIGVGHLVHLGRMNPHNSAEAKFKNGLTDSQIEELFREDVRAPEREVNDHVRVPLTQNQFDALVSRAFNLRRAAFIDSTLLRLLNQGDYIGAAGQFSYLSSAYDKTHHSRRSLGGLEYRRGQEEALFSKR